MSSYFPILIAHDPAIVLPPKPLPVDDLQGRLCCCCWSTEELITRQCRGFVLSTCPSLALEGEAEKRKMKKRKTEKRRSLISPLRLCIPFIPDCLGDLLAPPRFLPTHRCIACLLSHNDIVTGNNTSAYHEVSAATMDEWRCNGKANSSCCHLQVFGGTLLLGRVCR